MQELEKPPIGAPPYWYIGRERIMELCRAIEEYAVYSTLESVGTMKMWAKEIVLKCEMIEKMKEEAQTRMRHDFINVRKAHGKPDV